ncbi:unnamed protein product [Psylliodes chrysocephalus]|uniref:Uncharacterized protein n=1 Tax=Psylliodes chrysocephalus TaxID=3402493 RepID=A0A9P0CVL5_9CUCU|nr:unnamed protein product [Psylliodes chrysocephala]
MELKHVIIVFGTFIIVVKSAPTTHSNTQSQNPTPAGIEMKIEAPNQPRTTRSYGTQLDYVFNVDWNKDLFKFFNVPMSYDLTDSTSYFATPTTFGSILDYSSHESTPAAELYQHYQEPPLSQEEHYEHYEEPSPEPHQYPPYIEPHSQEEDYQQYKGSPSPHIYNVQLFFEDIPHIKLLLDNQKIREANHLQLNNLGSLRMGHPFERYPNSDRKFIG